MAAQSPRRRVSAATQDNRPVKLSVPIAVGTHSRLCALAALRRMPVGALAAQFIDDGLKGKVIVVDKQAKPADHADPTDEVESAA